MYRNKFPVAEYAMRGTVAGANGLATVGAHFSLGNYKECYLVAYVASSHPHYNSRMPKIGFSIQTSGDNPDKLIKDTKGRWALSKPITASTLPLCTLSGYATNYYPFNISQYGYGNVKINHWLAQGVAGATARATYSIWVIGKGEGDV
jgi:hypothetical protein